MVAPVYLVITPYFPTPGAWRSSFVYDQVSTLKKLRPDWRFVVVNTDAAANYVYREFSVIGIRMRYFHGAIILPSLADRTNARRIGFELSRAGIALSEIRYIHCHTYGMGGVGVQLRRLYSPRAYTMLQLHHPRAYCAEGTPPLRAALTFFHQRNVLSKIDLLLPVSRFVERMATVYPWRDPGLYYDPAITTRRYLRFFKPAKIRDSYVLHNGVVKSVFKEKTKQRGVKPIRIGCIGNFLAWKDQVTLIRAVKILRDEGFDLVARFVGSGPCRSACESLVNENNLQGCITFESEVEHEQLVGFYHSIDLFVLPSIYEAFGCVFAEAHACGVPFITCVGQGMDDLIPQEDRERWLVPPKNCIALAQAIKRYIEDPSAQQMTSDIDITMVLTKFLNRIESRGR